LQQSPFFWTPIICMTDDMVELLRCYWQNGLDFLFARWWYKHFQYCLHDAHNKKGSCNVERPRLGIVSKHFTQCKGHSKGHHLPMWQGVFWVSFHHRHEVDICYEDAVQVWTIHGKSRRGSSFSPKPYEGTYVLLCLFFFKRVKKLVWANILGSNKLPSLIENIMSTLNEICPKALAKILEPILCSSMVCLNIFEWGVVTYVCLVCLFICLNFCSFYILFIFKLVKSSFVKNARKKM
jgi:hypothetical protein